MFLLLEIASKKKCAGAAGVMYTSFLGLILDDLIALGSGKYKKC